MDIRLNNVYRKLLNLQSLDYKALDSDLANCVNLMSEGKDLSKLLANRTSVTELLTMIQTRFNQLHITSSYLNDLEKRITQFYETGV